MNKHRKWATLQNQEQKTATLRMALFPESAEVIFVHPEMWVVSLISEISTPERCPLLTALSSPLSG